MSKLAIHGITVSVDVGDKDYGKGQSCFMNLQGKYPEPGQPIEELDDVMMDGLDLYFAAWRTLLAGRFSSGQITGSDFKETLAHVTTRLEKVRRFLKTDDGQQQHQ